MSIKLTKDDLYDIEQALDVYSGFITEHLHKLCDSAMRYSGYMSMRKECDCTKTPLDDSILAMKEAYDKFKVIRDKLENNRLGDKK